MGMTHVWLQRGYRLSLKSNHQFTKIIPHHLYTPVGCPHKYEPQWGE